MSAARTIDPAFSVMPDAKPSHHDAPWLTKAIVYAPLVAATALAKFSLPGLTSIGGMLIPVVIVVLALGLATGRLWPVPKRFAIFLLMLSVLSLVQVLRGDRFSIPSLILMAVYCFAYVPAAYDGVVTNKDAERFFRNLTFTIAVAGIVQFGLQFVAGVGVAFPIEHFVPESFRTQGYNDMNVLSYGSNIYKANGFVMLEPSVFCQLSALGLTAELIHKSRGWRLAAYAGAIVVSYSGTGLLILAVTLPMLLVLHRRWDLLVRGLVLVALLAVLVEPLHLDVTLRRMTEFNSSGSSAFLRFVGWMTLFADKLWTDPARALLGYGSGSFFDMSIGYRAGEMAHAKIIFEFGVLGALLYFTFICYCVMNAQTPLVLRIGLLVAYFMNAAYSPSVTGIACSLLLWPGPVPSPLPAPSRRQAVQHA
jgi:hypothetical protein